MAHYDIQIFLYIMFQIYKGKQKNNINTYFVNACVPDGPGNVAIKGPSVFVTNGSRVMTLTCEASDVYPPPGYVWSGDVPCSSSLGNVCTLMPKGSHHHGKKVKCTAASSIFVIRPVVVTEEYSLNLQCKFWIYIYIKHVHSKCFFLCTHTLHHSLCLSHAYFFVSKLKNTFFLFLCFYIYCLFIQDNSFLHAPTHTYIDV